MKFAMVYPAVPGTCDITSTHSIRGHLLFLIPVVFSSSQRLSAQGLHTPYFLLYHHTVLPQPSFRPFLAPAFLYCPSPQPDIRPVSSPGLWLPNA